MGMYDWTVSGGAGRGSEMVVDVMHILSLQGYNLMKNKHPITQLPKC
jgi:hypothetical protein